MSVPLISFVAALVLAVSASVTASPVTPETLAAKAGCTVCHAKDKKVVGPALHAIAAKYKSNSKAPALLAATVRHGSKGAWGKDSIMPPVAVAQIGDADLAAVIAWVLQQ